MTGIPSYRLPRGILSREADIIKKVGVEIKLNTRMGRDITLEQLSSQGFKAIFIATGAHLGRELGIKAEKEGLIDGVEFLRNVNLGKRLEAKDRVIIIGGGNVAVDCARTCLRLGFKDVTIVYRRSRAEMPGTKEEIEEAEGEGAKITFLAAPVKVLTEASKVIGVECIRMELGEPDASGRKRPVPIPGSEFVIETDMVIPAIGEMPDLFFLSGKKTIKTTEQGTIEIAPYSSQTSQPGIFSGGDCVTGPATLIKAIAAGNRVAKSIDQYLRLGRVAPSEEDWVEDIIHDVSLSRQREEGIIVKGIRQSPEQLAKPDRKLNFNEVEQCLASEAATNEAERCLRCYRVVLLAINGDK